MTETPDDLISQATDWRDISTAPTILPAERQLLEDVAAILNAHGITINLPWQGDLDDLEREGFMGLLTAMRCARARHFDEPTVGQSSPSMTSNTFERVQVCVSDILGAELGRIGMDTQLAADLGADSLDAVELLLRLEEEFGFPVEDEDFDRFAYEDRPVSEIVALFAAKEA